VRSHPLAAVAAVARRRSSLRPIGLELFMLSPGLEPHLQQTLGQLSGPFWDAPSTFFTFRCKMRGVGSPILSVVRVYHPGLGYSCCCTFFPATCTFW
jgi:hypothetical protein